MQTLLNKLNTDPYYKVFRIHNSDKTNLKKQFLVFANKLGKIRSQNLKKDKIIEIKPNTQKIKKLKQRGKKIKSVLRYHQTNLGGSIHSDGPQLVNPPKYIIMACENESKSGGETILVDTKKIYEYLKKKNKKILNTLERKFVFERRGFNYKNKNVFLKPIFRKNNFMFRYLRDYIEKGFLIKNKKINHNQKIAMNFLDKLLRSKKFVTKFKLKRGQLVILNNHILAHGRSTFKIKNNSDVNRKLYRIWLN